MEILVAPSILSADFSDLKSEVKNVEKAGANWLHIDVMDGHFVPNITIGACVVKDLKKVSSLPLDCHLMIENPEKYYNDFVNAGAYSIVFHYEATLDKTSDLIKKIKQENVKVGLSIKPATKIEEIKKYLDDLDLVLIMSVEPGFSGQKFINQCADKISEIRKINKDILIQVDGGINEKTAAICIKNGANCLVSGNFIFKSDNIKKSIEAIKNAK